MKLSPAVRLTLIALAASAATLHAQRGCFHSPEAPTGVLMLVGSTGMVFGSSLLRKLMARKHNSE